MPKRLVLRGSLRAYRVDAGGRVGASASLGETPAEVARLLNTDPPVVLPASVQNLLSSGGTDPISVADPFLLSSLSDGDLRRAPPSLGELRVAREALPVPPAESERALLLALADERIRKILRDPEEVLISLAREEERVERSFDREVAAADHWLDAGSPPLTEYAESWRAFREQYEQHHTQLSVRVEAAARRVVPNLSELVGPRVAARLVSGAGSRSALARMSGSRLQLLGARRRPSHGRGPRYGLLYRASRMTDVPPDRGGAYARSLAALAVIAARADTTGASIGRELVARRDRRIERLRRQRK
ncbi:MAG: hypothetical protein L3K19_04540 [Thermoplasmata archaeon]|nr:hypothetical protein [Thermoplasmata archaeon]